jgi:hypothetical protein
VVYDPAERAGTLPLFFPNETGPDLKKELLSKNGNKAKLTFFQSKSMHAFRCTRNRITNVRLIFRALPMFGILAVHVLVSARVAPRRLDICFQV